MRNYYQKNKEHFSKLEKDHRTRVYLKLGGKCTACGEVFNPKLKRSNLEIHHKFYSEKEIEVIRHGKPLGSRTYRQVNKMFKEGEDPTKKFILLCKFCNLLEGQIKTHPKKAKLLMKWMREQGHFKQI